MGVSVSVILLGIVPSLHLGHRDIYRHGSTHDECKLSSIIGARTLDAMFGLAK